MALGAACVAAGCWSANAPGVDAGSGTGTKADGGAPGQTWDGSLSYPGVPDVDVPDASGMEFEQVGPYYDVSAFAGGAVAVYDQGLTFYEDEKHTVVPLGIHGGRHVWASSANDVWIAADYCRLTSLEVCTSWESSLLRYDGEDLRLWSSGNLGFESLSTAPGAGVAAGPGGTVLHRTADGWIPFDLPAPACDGPCTHDISQVYVAGPEQAFAVSEFVVQETYWSSQTKLLAGSLLRFDGQRWETEEVGVWGDEPTSVRDVHGSGVNHVYALVHRHGEDGLGFEIVSTALTHFDGTSWSLVAEFEGAVRDVLAAGPEDVWVMRSSDELFHCAGASCEQLEGPGGSSARFIGAHDGLVYTLGTSDSESLVSRLEDGEWQALPAIEGDDPAPAMLVDGLVTAEGDIYVSDLGGIHRLESGAWQQIWEYPDPENLLDAVGFLAWDGQALYRASLHGEIHRYSDQQVVVELDPPRPCALVSDLAGSSPDRVYASCARNRSFVDAGGAAPVGSVAVFDGARWSTRDLDWTVDSSDPFALESVRMRGVAAPMDGPWAAVGVGFGQGGERLASLWITSGGETEQVVLPFADAGAVDAAANGSWTIAGSCDGLDEADDHLASPRLAVWDGGQPVVEDLSYLVDAYRPTGVANLPNARVFVTQCQTLGAGGDELAPGGALVKTGDQWSRVLADSAITAAAPTGDGGVYAVGWEPETDDQPGRGLFFRCLE